MHELLVCCCRCHNLQPGGETESGNPRCQCQNTLIRRDGVSVRRCSVVPVKRWNAVRRSEPGFEHRAPCSTRAHRAYISPAARNRTGLPHSFLNCGRAQHRSQHLVSTICLRTFYLGSAVFARSRPRPRRTVGKRHCVSACNRRTRGVRVPAIRVIYEPLAKAETGEFTARNKRTGVAD